MKFGPYFFAAILLPAAILVMVVLSVQHFQIDQALRRNEDLQDRLIERNKRYITQESILSSPTRLRLLAEGTFGRSQPDSGQNLYFYVEEARGDKE